MNDLLRNHESDQPSAPASLLLGARTLLRLRNHRPRSPRVDAGDVAVRCEHAFTELRRLAACLRLGDRARVRAACPGPIDGTRGAPSDSGSRCLFLVSLQMTTYLRPVLWQRSPGDVIALEKQSFFTHLAQVVDFRPAPPPPIPRGIKPPSPAALVSPPAAQ